MRLVKWLSIQKKDLVFRLSRYPKRRYFLAAFLVSFLFGGLFKTWSFLDRDSVVFWDRFIVDRFAQLRTPFLDFFFSQITLFGSLSFVVGLLILLAVFLFLTRRKRAAFVSLLVLSVSVFFLFFFKDFFGRPRPGGCVSYSLDCFSYPSGHVTLSFYFYGLIGYLLNRFFLTSKKTLFILWVGILILVGLIALSRVYLGIHYFSDLVGGALLGSILLTGAVLLIDFLY